MTTLDDRGYRELAEKDQRYLIHSQHYAPDHQEPVIYEHGEGVWLTDVRGRRYLDALSSLWNVAVGHGRAELADAAAEQMRKVAFANAYVGFSNTPAIELAEKVISLTYENMGGVFFTNSGTEANEGSFKIARFYWNWRGRSEKVKLISRERSYHGSTLAAATMTGLQPFWKSFGPLAPGIVHTGQPDNLECDCVPNTDGECACWLEAAILREGPETVAAVLMEPVKGAGGVWPPSDEYFVKVRALCDQYDILLIVDEVITGFGRTGRWFALQHWDVQPDLVSVAKALTSAYVPMGATIVSHEIMAAFQDLPSDGRFMHGYTNSAHPTAAAVGLRNLQIMEDEGLVERAAAMGDRLGNGLREALGGHPHVDNIRNLGLMAGITLMRDAAAGVPYEASEAVGAQVGRDLREERGIITRFIGDHVLFAPPLVVSEAEVDQIIDATVAAVRAVTGE